MKRIFSLLVLSFVLASSLTGCFTVREKVVMQRDPKMGLPTPEPAATKIAELETATPAAPESALTTEWQRISTPDGMVSLEIPGDWTASGGELAYQSPDGKVTFGIVRQRVQPGVEIEASLIPGSSVVRESRDLPVGDRTARRILIDRLGEDGANLGVESHYLIRRMDGKEVFDFYFAAPSDVELNEAAPVIQHALDSMIWAMID